MNTKRGLSDVVTTVLIILLVLGAIVLLWQFLKPTLDKSGQQITAQSECLQVDLAPTVCDATADTVTIKINKKGQISGAKVIITDATGASTVTDVPTITESELSTKTVTVTSTAGDVATVAAVVTIDGKSTTCSESAVKVTCA